MITIGLDWVVGAMVFWGYITIHLALKLSGDDWRMELEFSRSQLARDLGIGLAVASVWLLIKLW